ncbi:MAG: 3D domain-containing protein [Bacilli bacterium]|nr:3D domain-containing protein [Bacilli bacterium]
MKTYERYIYPLLGLIIFTMILFNIPKSNIKMCSNIALASIPSYKFEHKKLEKIEKTEIKEIETIEEPVVIKIDSIVKEVKNTLNYNPIDTLNIPVIETTYGTASAYSPYCYGCSGYTASGYDVKNNTYYQDNTFGTIKIVAADSKYPFGTIVRINSSIIAIVLDRGGGIGINKKFQYDILTSSDTEAYQIGVMYNAKFEILRLGY